MIIFVDDDVACRQWLTHHRRGYAVEGMRNRKHGRLVLHSAVCPAFRETIHRGRATTHHRWTACSLSLDELAAWCATEYGAEPPACEVCLSLDRQQATDEDEHHLTRVARDILDYVLDVAVIHLEPDAKLYRLTIADVAQCLHKTPGQLAAALDRLEHEGLIVVDAPAGRRASQADHRGLYPTPAAMQTLPYFAEWDRPKVDAEVAKLRPDA